MRILASLGVSPQRGLRAFIASLVVTGLLMSEANITFAQSSLPPEVQTDILNRRIVEANGMDPSPL